MTDCAIMIVCSVIKGGELVQIYEGFPTRQHARDKLEDLKLAIKQDGIIEFANDFYKGSKIRVEKVYKTTRTVL